MAVIRFREAIGILRDSYLILVLRLFVGATFIFSAVTKLPLQSQFVEIVQSYHLLPDPLSTAYGIALPWIELLIGVYLLLGVLLKPSAFATILIGISFLIANVSAIVRGEQYCGSCFGESISLPVSQALTLDFLLMIAALLLLLAGGGKQLFGVDSWFTYRQHTKATHLNMLNT